jgi:uncharacterized protein
VRERGRADRAPFAAPNDALNATFVAMPEAARYLVSGTSGPIGKALLPTLQKRGRTTRLVRGAVTGDDQIRWDPARLVPPEQLEGFSAVIHLAGETIAGRWNSAKKARIRDSRLQGTKNLAEALAKTSSPPGVFVCASAIGYYGNRGDEILREESAPGVDFLAEVCREWEAATQPTAQAGIRTVNTRFGVILSRDGGALPKMLPPFRMGVGGRIGDGRQWMSWVHISDVVGVIEHVLDKAGVSGPVNVVAPSPTTNAEFTRTLAAVLHRPAIFPLPAFAVRLAFGEMGEALLLGSQRVEPGKLRANGYEFQFSQLAPALASILQGW